MKKLEYEKWNMGKVKEISLVKLICGFISNKLELFKEASSKLKIYFGEIDFESEIFLFVHTDYYEEEMGKDLRRKFISFKKLIERDRLAEIKLITNRLEEEFSTDGKRKINIDPGYITFSNLILASTKDYYHRIYIGRGIFAEVTLYYKDKKFNYFPWSYPDYRSREYLDTFSKIREIYRSQIKRGEDEGSI